MNVEPTPPWASQLISEAEKVLKKCTALEATMDEKTEELKKQSESLEKLHRDVRAGEEILRMQQQKFLQLLNRVEMLSPSTLSPAIDAIQGVNQSLGGEIGEIGVTRPPQAVFTASQSNQLASEITRGPSKGSSGEGVHHQQHRGSNKRGRAIDYEVSKRGKTVSYEVKKRGRTVSYEVEFLSPEFTSSESTSPEPTSPESTSPDAQRLSRGSIGELGSARRANRAKPSRIVTTGIAAHSSTSEGAKIPADKV